MFESGGGSCSARTKLFIATIHNAAYRNMRASHLLAGFWGTEASATHFFSASASSAQRLLCYHTAAF